MSTPPPPRYIYALVFHRVEERIRHCHIDFFLISNFANSRVDDFDERQETQAKQKIGAPGHS